ncbi:hypothetical protein AMAG_10674 [Allomyces macrogynus ATCC 38327]|uniref:Hsp70-like protein n=1 Tax=Allomyces macrogynus (strain ATCC 38327) TaxID=578462 RepID=A0A0L0SR60_ALLM3|nr:hypothetical protein AMAG_10674 [Allomyces macrogynus ATCC 38327]|eukprot:KNE65008.1 hypothetical protein AMAG_10674 [Allomyces macrogynus ATCC 38327]
MTRPCSRTCSTGRLRSRAMTAGVRASSWSTTCTASSSSRPRNSQPCSYATSRPRPRRISARRSCTPFLRSRQRSPPRSGKRPWTRRRLPGLILCGCSMRRRLSPWRTASRPRTRPAKASATCWSWVSAAGRWTSRSRQSRTRSWKSSRQRRAWTLAGLISTTGSRPTSCKNFAVGTTRTCRVTSAPWPACVGRASAPSAPCRRPSWRPLLSRSCCPGTDVCTTVTRARFEDMCDDLFRAVVEPVEQVLRDAHMEPSNVHEILLVGGASRMPKVQQLLADMFGGRARITLGSQDAAVHGAAIMGAILSRDPSTAIHDLTLLDVVPHTLSLQVGNGPLIPIVPRGTIVPARKAELVPLDPSTPPPDFILVYENLTPLFGRLDLSALTPETPHIHVTFDLDAAAHLAVTVTDDLDQHRVTAKITGPNRLLQVDLDRMRTDLDRMCKADHEAAARIRARNRLERYVVTLRGNTVRNPPVAARMCGEDVDRLESVVAETLHWLDYAGEDVGRVDFEQVLADVEARANAVVAEYLDVVGGSEGQ